MMKRIINLRSTLGKLVNFYLKTIVMHRCYIPLEKLFDRKLQRWGFTREEIVVEFTNIEPTAPTNSEDHTSLFPEVKEFALVRRSIAAEDTPISICTKESPTGCFTFINTMCKSFFLIFEMFSFNTEGARQIFSILTVLKLVSF